MDSGAAHGESKSEMFRLGEANFKFRSTIHGSRRGLQIFLPLRG